jgi:hypothetical protein
MVSSCCGSGVPRSLTLQPDLGDDVPNDANLCAALQLVIAAGLRVAITAASSNLSYETSRMSTKHLAECTLLLQ